MTQPTEQVSPLERTMHSSGDFHKLADQSPNLLHKSCFWTQAKCVRFMVFGSFTAALQCLQNHRAQVYPHLRTKLCCISKRICRGHTFRTMICVFMPRIVPVMPQPQNKRRLSVDAPHDPKSSKIASISRTTRG